MTLWVRLRHGRLVRRSLPVADHDPSEYNTVDVSWAVSLLAGGCRPKHNQLRRRRFVDVAVVAARPIINMEAKQKN